MCDRRRDQTGGIGSGAGPERRRLVQDTPRRPFDPPIHLESIAILSGQRYLDRLQIHRKFTLAHPDVLGPKLLASW